MKLIVIDTETSDLDPAEGAAILELAWMVVSHIGDEWKTTSAYESYIQYEGPISPKAQASHHIQDSCLKPGRALPRTVVVEKLLQVVEPDSFIVAHNAEFDSKFLPEIANSWICTYRASKRIWPSAPGYGNQVLRYWLGIDPDLALAPTVRPRAPHQALYDVATTTGILLRMLKTYSPAELYQFNQPMLLEAIDFGKHKGMPFKQIPRDYLMWLKEQTWLNEDLRHTVNITLQT